ncbi:LINE-1 retrotransposable element ORF2 protein [Xyrichtys novacula]|uniref:LINE-1 retrotransposable element ORF2 protein n=1 Tax=Xyrichtys novacula TaxID=13765 RepID=A0AAV1HMX4_XYRNO|nr:LINE-1 retrotransposable element ORF2 protein [Xyrichtys novacula]
MPPCIQSLIASYFNDLQISFTLQDFTTGWQQLQMGCAISPILFVAAFGTFPIGEKQMVGGLKLPSGQRLPQLRNYMDNVTSFLQTATCTAQLLKRMDELMAWAKMKIKPPSYVACLLEGESEMTLLPLSSGERQFLSCLNNPSKVWGGSIPLNCLRDRWGKLS